MCKGSIVVLAGRLTCVFGEYLDRHEHIQIYGQNQRFICITCVSKNFFPYLRIFPHGGLLAKHVWANRIPWHPQAANKVEIISGTFLVAISTCSF